MDTLTSFSATAFKNGIDTTVLAVTVDVVRTAPDTGRFRFRAGTEWVDGTHSRSTVRDYHGVGQNRSRERAFTVDSDHPLLLVGRDNGPTPVEYVLHALTSCLTAGIVLAAAQRGVRLTDVRSTVVGDLDLNGMLGLDPGVRKGFGGIGVHITVDGDAPPEVLAEIVEHARTHSAVFDIVTNPVPVTVDVG
jgi:uncharacterized OsmC-like protein